MMMSVSESTKFVDYYSLLQVTPSADTGQIRAGYITMAKLHHPDTGGSTELMQGLTQAYQTLSSATSRAAYDMLHSFHTGGPISQYKEVGGATTKGAKHMSDEYVDFFIDSVFAEYHDMVQPKPTVKAKIKRFFQA